MILDSSKKKNQKPKNKRLQVPGNNTLKEGMANIGTVANLGYHCKLLLWKILALREMKEALEVISTIFRWGPEREKGFYRVKQLISSKARL